MDTQFIRLLRFSDPDGTTWYGEAPSVVDPAELLGKSVEVFEGGEPWKSSFRKTGSSRKVQKILSPLEKTPFFCCVGLNYRKHIEETGMKTPQVPAIFFKGPESLAGPLDVIEVHNECPAMDYEGELCAIIGKPCKNLKDSDDALSYVLGYAVGNDVSCRYWQERAGPAYAKSFDRFAPIGPFITSLKAVHDVNNLRLTTKVNGEIRQNARTDDLLFDVSAIIRFLSRGRTLTPGTVIMTGTPSGVGLGSKPPRWLKDGDIVEIEIESLGIIRNRFVIPPVTEVRL